MDEDSSSLEGLEGPDVEVELGESEDPVEALLEAIVLVVAGREAE